jgi:arabinofuranosyltransferase
MFDLRRPWGVILTKKAKCSYCDWTVVFILGVVALSCGWIYRNFAQDDAFITYRYAKNIANGHGFVYNSHEPVLGTTTPLYTLWLALLGKLSGQDIRLISHWVSVFSLWIGGILLYDLGRSSGILSASAVSLVFVSNPLLAHSMGMETCFLNLILLLALTSYVQGKLNLTGVLLGLLVLTRYETILFAGILALHFVIKRKQMPLWSTCIAVLFLAWTIFAWRSFGSIIPQSVSAKLVAELGSPFALGAIVWWRIYAAQTAWYDLVLPLILLGTYAAIRNRKSEQANTLILIWSGVYFVGASLVAGSFPWYYGPLIPGLSILLVGGIEFLTRFLSTLLGRFYSTKRLAQLTQASVLTVVTLGLVGLHISSWNKGGVVYRGQVVDSRYVVYREAADWLNRRAGDDQTLATPEIGVLGYYTDMKIIDLYGLVTPTLTPWAEQDIRETLRKAIGLYAPDYILTDKGCLIELLQQYPEYKPAQRFGEDAYVLYDKTTR